MRTNIKFFRCCQKSFVKRFVTNKTATRREKSTFWQTRKPDSYQTFLYQFNFCTRCSFLKLYSRVQYRDHGNLTPFHSKYFPRYHHQYKSKNRNFFCKKSFMCYAHRIHAAKLFSDPLPWWQLIQDFSRVSPGGAGKGVIGFSEKKITKSRKEIRKHFLSADLEKWFRIDSKKADAGHPSEPDMPEECLVSTEHPRRASGEALDLGTGVNFSKKQEMWKGRNWAHSPPNWPWWLLVSLTTYDYGAQCLRIYSQLWNITRLRLHEIIIDQRIVLYEVGTYTSAITSTIAITIMLGNGLCTQFERFHKGFEALYYSQNSTISSRCECQESQSQLSTQLH